MIRPRLLVVDDDPYTRDGLHTIFTMQGWQVSLAGSVAQGLALLEPAPHCLILDLMLPDGGGEALLRQARTRCPGIRVAVCSGIDDPGRLALVRDLDPDLLLCKPYDLAPVYQMCEAAMARLRSPAASRALSPIPA